MNFLEVMACSKLQVSKIKYGYQIKKKNQFMNPGMLGNQTKL